MIIIPARLGSTRFPQKILCDIGGMPMFIRSAKNAQEIDEVILALDSHETCEIAKQYNIQYVMTDPAISNGSLRVLEASKILGLKSDTTIINLQADEPFLEHSVILSLRDSMHDNPFMATCAKEIDSENAQNPNIVKVVLNHNSEAIYFSRSCIPFYRDNANVEQKYLGHLGLYAYSKESLEELADLPETELENIEKLEQLRAIYYNKIIKVVCVESHSIGIDTPQDLEEAKKMYGI
ncbi:3-deoxy-manno-octulosonate cytidylyltransferase [Helicobacter didelphidarum]|uniref:3-deoxy-manno-octulosonate cytidylyltransferase n=1 Tax=Helicobacter didelphidarum TaxID=2040648 RepID=A0A3D8IRB4_9HELI|nr:3-deoxy-manno-octulosonate cytidylyltransferase [Helicobacter didelphidarum]RDU67520.1 3-deoxy-manno-octulosonate cytidylyltransferase [Helicobacter didelphidarum]